MHTSTPWTEAIPPRPPRLWLFLAVVLLHEQGKRIPSCLIWLFLMSPPSRYFLGKLSFFRSFVLRPLSSPLPIRIGRRITLWVGEVSPWDFFPFFLLEAVIDLIAADLPKNSLFCVFNRINCQDPALLGGHTFLLYAEVLGAKPNFPSPLLLSIPFFSLGPHLRL